MELLVVSPVSVALDDIEKQIKEKFPKGLLMQVPEMTPQGNCVGHKPWQPPVGATVFDLLDMFNGEKWRYSMHTPRTMWGDKPEEIQNSRGLRSMTEMYAMCFHYLPELSFKEFLLEIERLDIAQERGYFFCCDIHRRILIRRRKFDEQFRADYRGGIGTIQRTTEWDGYLKHKYGVEGLYKIAMAELGMKPMYYNSRDRQPVETEDNTYDNVNEITRLISLSPLDGNYTYQVKG